MSTTPDRMLAGVVGGRYEIDGLIASGGMGTVYRARDTVLGRIVALKVLRNDDGDFVSRFRTEAMNAARLSHHNIVAVYDYGDADGKPYMAMEFVDGQTLRDIMISGGALRPDHAAGIAGQVARALDHAHRAGIVHRDIKPENILVATDGTVKVADFGLSRALAESRATNAGTVLGTAQYLAPEQVQTGYADNRSDVYALGVVLYEMLTGVPAFGGDSPVTIAYKHVNEDVPTPSDVNPGVPRSLDAIVLHATARDADERYPTAGALAAALRNAMPAQDPHALGSLVQHTEAIPLAPPETADTVVLRSAVTPPRRTGRRRTWMALALALLLAGTFLTVTTFAHVRVPEVTGLTQDDARLLLDRARLHTDIELRNDAVVPSGHVIEQRPAAHLNARRWSTVHLLVSLGPELATLLDVRGQTYDAAAAALRKAGFPNIVRADDFSSTVAKSRVMAEDPDPGPLVAKDTQITLTVSKGAEIVGVPNVVGEQQAAATSDLRASGFKVAVVQQETLEAPAGQVMSQSPGAGAHAAKGTTVTIAVAKSPPLRAVPDLHCMTKSQAQDALASAGFQATFEGRGKRVVDQDPPPNQRAPQGTTVTAFMGSGAYLHC